MGILEILVLQLIKRLYVVLFLCLAETFEAFQPTAARRSGRSGRNSFPHGRRHVFLTPRPFHFSHFTLPRLCPPYPLSRALRRVTQAAIGEMPIPSSFNSQRHTRKPTWTRTRFAALSASRMCHSAHLEHRQSRQSRLQREHAVRRTIVHAQAIVTFNLSV